MRLTERSGVRGLAALTTVVLLAAAASPCAAQSQGITLTEVIQLQRGGVSNRQILRSATEYCRAFNVTDEVVGMLRTAGSDDALIAGLRRALELAVPEVEVVSDSELLVKQMRGEYKVKNEALRELSLEAARLARRLGKVEYRHVRRAHNELADSLVNEALDSG